MVNTIRGIYGSAAWPASLKKAFDIIIAVVTLIIDFSVLIIITIIIIIIINRDWISFPDIKTKIGKILYLLKSTFLL